MRLKLVDYDAMRKAFDEKFKGTMMLIEEGETHLDNLAEGFHEADGVIWSMPIIDAVPVVRCKDCDYSRPLNRKDPFEDTFTEGCIWCHKHGDAVFENDFCSYGKPKDGDT